MENEQVSDTIEYVALVTGEVAQIFPDRSQGMRDYWGWSIQWENGESGVAYGREWAVKSANYASVRRSWHPRPVPGFSAADALALDGAERSTYTRTLKRLLVKRTGCQGFSVTGGRGTGSSWIHVRGSNDTTQYWIAALFGPGNGPDASIPPTRGYRALYAAKAAGVSTDGIDCAEHGWD
jgi:hypothetical protein